MNPTPEDSEELGKILARITELAHEAGFNAGRQAAVEFISISEFAGNVPNKKQTDDWFNYRRRTSLNHIATLLRRNPV